MFTRRIWLQRFGLLVAGATFVPRWLSARTTVQVRWEDTALLDELCETILPETDTPGAKAAGVPAYVRTWLKDSATNLERGDFQLGLERVESEADYRFGVNFEACNLEQRNAVVRSFEGSRFYDLLKNVVRNGYFTSETGCTQALRYDPVPGRWEADVHYLSGEKAWAT